MCITFLANIFGAAHIIKDWFDAVCIKAGLPPGGSNAALASDSIVHTVQIVLNITASSDIIKKTAVQ